MAGTQIWRVSRIGAADGRASRRAVPEVRGGFGRPRPDRAGPGMARRRESRPVLTSGLIPVTTGAQEPAHRSRDRDGVQGHRLDGVADGRVQVRALGFQPCCRLLGAGHPGGHWPAGAPAAGGRRQWSSWRCACWRRLSSECFRSPPGVPLALSGRQVQVGQRSERHRPGGGQPGGVLAGRRCRSAEVSSPVEISSSASSSRARGPRSPGAPRRA